MSSVIYAETDTSACLKPPHHDARLTLPLTPDLHCLLDFHATAFLITKESQYLAAAVPFFFSPGTSRLSLIHNRSSTEPHSQVSFYSVTLIAVSYFGWMSITYWVDCYHRGRRINIERNELCLSTFSRRTTYRTGVDGQR